MTELFDQEDEPRRGRVYTAEETRSILEPETLTAPLTDADPDPLKYETAAEHTAAYVEQRNQEYRLEQIGRNLRGMAYLSKAGVSQVGIDEYLAGNKIEDAPPLRRRLWRFDAWTQRHFWNVILVLVALLTVAGFGVVAAHSVLNEDSAVGFIIFLLGIGGITAEVIRRG